MLESGESLLPLAPRGRALRSVIVGFEEDSLDEMESLLQTLGVEVTGRLCVTLRQVTPATYVGGGKLEEIKRLTEASEADSVIIDRELSPNQLRNLEKVVGKPSVDRPGVILEIFSRHARTKEAKTQVELAKLQYLLPRLAHFWSHLERQRGGGVTGRGMGEKQIEVDRRLLKRRISFLNRRLVEIEKERTVQRQGRDVVLKVAFVGYTNAGKSTLLNALTQSNVLAENKLFATLDATVRSLDPDSHPPIVAIDTVGFISNIPTTLIASFRSTLEELHQADLLLHVVDASSPRAKDQLRVTEDLLKELGLEDKDRITVLNKIDRVTDPTELNWVRLTVPGAQRVSALNREDAIRLRDLIMEHFRNRLEVYEIVVPYSEGKLDAQLHAYGSVDTVKYLEKGTFYRVRIDAGWAGRLGLNRYRTGTKSA